MNRFDQVCYFLEFFPCSAENRLSAFLCCWWLLLRAYLLPVNGGALALMLVFEGENGEPVVALPLWQSDFFAEDALWSASSRWVNGLTAD